MPPFLSVPISGAMVPKEEIDSLWSKAETLAIAWIKNMTVGSEN